MASAARPQRRRHRPSQSTSAHLFGVAPNRKRKPRSCTNRGRESTAGSCSSGRQRNGRLAITSATGSETTDGKKRSAKLTSAVCRPIYRRRTRTPPRAARRYGTRVWIDRPDGPWEVVRCSPARRRCVRVDRVLLSASPAATCDPASATRLRARGWRRAPSAWSDPVVRRRHSSRHPLGPNDDLPDDHRVRPPRRSSEANSARTPARRGGWTPISAPSNTTTTSRSRTREVESLERRTSRSTLLGRHRIRPRR